MERYLVKYKEVIFLFIMPIGAFLVGAFFSDAVAGALKAYTLVLYLAFGLAVNIVHKILLNKSEKYRSNNEGWKIPYLYYIPAFCALSSLAIVLTIMSNDFNFGSGYLGRIKERLGQDYVEIRSIEEKKSGNYDTDSKVTLHEGERSLAYSAMADKNIFLPSFDSNFSLRMQFASFVKDRISKLQISHNMSLEKIASYEDMGKTLFRNIDEKAWEEFRENVDLLASEIENVDSIAVNILLMTEAPSDIIMEYVQRGGEVAPTSLLSQLQNGRFALLDELENYGVDFFDDSKTQISLFDMALMVELPPQSFEYLLSKAEDLGKFRPVMGTDAIGIMLIYAGKNAAFASYYVNSMLKKNALITEQHLSFMKHLKIDSPLVYEELLLAIPELSEN